jgi:hypothetical protein
MCHHGLAHPQVAKGGGCLHICYVAASVLKTLWRTADRRWYSYLDVGREGVTSSLGLEFRPIVWNVIAIYNKY